MRRPGLALALLAVVGACAAPPARLAPGASPAPAAAPAAPFECRERLELPELANVIEARWSPDGARLALTSFATLPSPRTPTGWEEEWLLDTLDVRTGVRRPLGAGGSPEWSGSGAYLSYWSPDGDELHIVRGGYLVAAPLATQPEVRWVGDELLFVEHDVVRRWSSGGVATVAPLPAALLPLTPRDDLRWSADGERYLLTRYARDGGESRWIVTTRSGAAAPLDAPGATYAEWAPSGHALLVRAPDRIELRAEDGVVARAPVPPTAVHGWTPDGRALVLGAVSPAAPGGEAFDSFTVWGAPEAAAAAVLPNLLGVRAFAPDGAHFAGVSRLGRFGTRLEVFRCGTGVERPAADAALAWRLGLAADPRRFVRPAAGAITQYVAGAHTGVDLATPLGALIVAADDGVVGEVGWVPVGGRRVCVLSEPERESCAYHVALALVAPGEHVVRGRPIALVGLTGVTTGPHVHWEVHEAGRIVDPLAR